MAHDELGIRMKEYYEHRSRHYLTRRTPVIIRLDGKAFHTFTRGFRRPYDRVLHTAMQNTMKYLCENIQGCKVGYTQSDEITLLLTDYDTLQTDAWFGYNVQKMCSVAASMATLAFNKEFEKAVQEYEFQWKHGLTPQDVQIQLEQQQYMSVLNNAVKKGALFDARAFNIPKEEVVNCFIWRQQDATRNAIQMLGQAYFNHNELQGKSCSDIQEMLMTEKRINFNDMPTVFKRGTCCYKVTKPHTVVDISDATEKIFDRSVWEIDTETPIFTQDRNYIGRYVNIDQD